jgi:F0F1-type ATP synthase membrane subunit b/b'
MEAAQLVQILCSAGLFLAVWFCLRGVLKPFIANVAERQDRTFGDETAASEMRQKAEVLDVELEDALRRARQEGAQARDARINAAKKEAQSMLEQAEAWAAAEVKKGEEEVARVKQRALAEVPAEVDKLSRLVVERALSSGGPSLVH